jgi:hypothetical protein
MEAVRREDFPQYLWLAMEDWAWCMTSPRHAWSITGSAECRVRSCRCPLCYQLDEPCPSCVRLSNQPRRIVDVDLSESIERAWVGMSVRRVEKQLLRGFFIWRKSPRRLAFDAGIRRDDFWFLLLRGAKEVYELARVEQFRGCSKTGFSKECSHRESDQAGCRINVGPEASPVATR